MSDGLELNSVFAEIGIDSVLGEVSRQDSTFSNLVSFLQLDSERDFRYSNLIGVDFSESDLRGYDFRGADLRSSYGLNIIFDDTTNFDDADVSDSCFASFVRERQIFKRNPDALKIYDFLKTGDSLDVSSWIHSRHGGGRDMFSGLTEVDSETASILCRKLLFDDIDITKRTDLLYRLKNICETLVEMRELMLDMLARHIENISVVFKVISIVAKEFKSDFTVFQVMLSLSRDTREQVRKIAFIALSRGKFFNQYFEEIRSSFMAPVNKSIRVSLIRAAAQHLGREYLEAISHKGSRDETSFGETFDYEEMLDLDIIEGLALQIDQRNFRINERIEGKKKNPQKFPTKPNESTISRIVKRQEEVLVFAQVINLISEKQFPKQMLDAKARLFKGVTV